MQQTATFVQQQTPYQQGSWPQQGYYGQPLKHNLVNILITLNNILNTLNCNKLIKRPFMLHQRQRDQFLPNK